MDIDKLLRGLIEEDRQRLMDQLHADGVYPSRLIGSGTPAHVEAINANLNDLRGLLQLNAVTMGKFYELIGARPGQPPPAEPREKEKEPEP